MNYNSNMPPYPGAGNPSQAGGFRPSGGLGFESIADPSPYGQPASTNNPGYPQGFGGTGYPSGNPPQPYPSQTNYSTSPSVPLQYPSANQSAFGPGSHQPSPYSAPQAPAYGQPSNNLYPSAPGVGPGQPYQGTGQGFGYPSSGAAYPSAPGGGYPPKAQPQSAPGPLYQQHGYSPSNPSYGYASGHAGGVTGSGGAVPGAGASVPGVRSAQTYGGSAMSYPYSTIFDPNRGSPTVKPYPNFNANADAEALRKAMKGLGCDSKSVINVLCNRSNQQRQQIKLAFKTMYGKDLVKELIDELRGNLEDLIVCLMTPPPEYDARELRKAMEGLGTTEATLIEIMCSRSNQQIHAIRDTYKQIFHRDLEKDLISETSGHFKRLLVSMSVGGRDESMQTNPAKAKEDAQALYKAGEKRLGTDESVFNQIIASQNYAQLQMVFQEYQVVSKHDIEVAIQKEFSGDIKDGLMTVIKCVKNRPAYFAERLHGSMKGLGTKDTTLIRVMVTRCEIDMQDIKFEFQRLYGKSLESFISGDTSGKYKDALLALAKGN